MKILFVQNIAGIAGSEKYFIAILPELKKRGIDCEFLSIYKSKDSIVANIFHHELTQLGIKVHSLSIFNYYSLKPVFKIRSLYRKNKYNFVHTHLIYADFWAALTKFFFNKKIKIISTLHGYQEDLYVKYCLNPVALPKTLYFYLAKFSLNKIDRIYACSYGLKKFYVDSGISHKIKIDVIQHGFDYPEINYSQKSVKQNKLQLIIVGRLIERKGHLFLLKNFHKIVNKFPNIELVILGSGDLELELKSYVIENNLSNYVRFEGFKKNVREYICKSDIVIVPSYAEGLPLVIFEAFSEKKPVVAFDTIGCNEAIKNNFNGILVPPFDENMLIDEIIKLLDDNTTRMRLGENGFQELMNHFSLERMVEDTISYYKK